MASAVSSLPLAYFFALAAVGLFWTGASAAESVVDKVTLRMRNSNSRVVVRGKVQDYTADLLRMRLRPSGEMEHFDASQVLQVETAQTTPHLKGSLRFSQGRFRAAQEQFQQALNQEDRAWVRREILAMLVRCALAQGDYATAGTRFLSLLESEPKTRHFHRIPLLWSGQADASLKNAAQRWLSSSQDAARLLAAAALVRDPDQSETAHDELQELVTSADYRVHQLARAQLWRVQLQQGTVSQRRLERWRSHVESMPKKLRGGPYSVLGRGYAEQRQHEQAAMALLWVPLVYDDDHRLAAQCCLQAAQNLQQIGQEREARILLREVTSRFAETPAAKQAASRLAEHPTAIHDE